MRGSANREPTSHPPSVPPFPALGEVVGGKFRIEKVAGEGGMGTVFAAHHLILDQRVALKVLSAEAVKGDTAVDRFVREAKAAARLSSEHVARVLDAGSLERGGLPFLVMEYLEGCDLEELLQLRGPLPVGEVCDYVVQALSGLALAHSVDIVHRDIKPANLFLAVRPDGSNVLKILDFGISKHLSASESEKKLTGHAVLGSPAYIAPEQLRNAKNVDHRADLWSMGVVIYELLTGRVPFDGDGVGEIFAAVLEQEPVPIRSVRPDVPEWLAEVVRRALRKSPEERFADAGEFARALEPYGSGRWTSSVTTIEKTLARSRKSFDTPPDGKALLIAAQEALSRSRPPSSGPFAAWHPPAHPLTPPDLHPGGGAMAFARTDDTLAGSPSAPSLHGRTTQTRRILTVGLLGGVWLVGAAIVVTVVLFVGATIRSRSAAAKSSPKLEATAAFESTGGARPAPQSRVDSTPVEPIAASEPSFPAVTEPERAPAAADAGSPRAGSTQRPSRTSRPRSLPAHPTARPKFLNTRD